MAHFTAARYFFEKNRTWRKPTELLGIGGGELYCLFELPNFGSFCSLADTVADIMFEPITRD